LELSSNFIIDKNVIPNSVTHLKISIDENETWKHIPSSVTQLEVTYYKSYKKKWVPPNVSHLVFQKYDKKCAPRNIPLHVESVTYKYVEYAHKQDQPEMFDMYDIPSHIKTITLGPLKIRNVF